MALLTLTHLLLTILLCIPQYHSITTKSVSLTPANPSKNGVTTNLIKGATNYAPFEFDLYAIDESSINMHISLDRTWSFHPLFTTILTLEIGSDTHLPTDDVSLTSLLISFSQNNNKYITSVIEIGEANDDIIMYPPPHMDGKYSTVSHGNIKQLIESKIHSNRIESATNNGSYGYFEPYISTPNVSYPLTFKMEYNPNFDYMNFTYFTPFIKPRNIIYYGMDVNNTMDIYLAAGNKNDNFDITYFNIKHSILGIINNNNNDTNPETTIETLLDNSNPETNTRPNWFDSALVSILISTVAIMCCLFFVFAVMFFKIFRNPGGLKVIEITSPKNPMKNEKPLQVIPRDMSNISNINSVNNLPNGSSLRMTPSFTSMTHTNSKSMNNVPATNTPTLNDILAVLGTKSTSLHDLHEHKQDDVSINDMNIIYNEVMRRKSTDRDNNNYNNRKISNITDTGDILYEMDEKNSCDELEGSDQNDLELECMYNKPNKDDIRRATVHRNNTPGHVKHNAIDELAIDENVNRISIIETMNSLKLQLHRMYSGDSEAMYEKGNDEGTPYGSTDTQYETGGITPYTAEHIHMANV